MFRGKLSMREVEECMVNYKIKNDQLFADWIPNNVKCAVCDIAPHGFKKCVTFAANNTAIVELFQLVPLQRGRFHFLCSMLVCLLGL